jgi:hypothetical protein
MPTLAHGDPGAWRMAQHGSMAAWQHGSPDNTPISPSIRRVWCVEGESAAAARGGQECGGTWARCDAAGEVWEDLGEVREGAGVGQVGVGAPELQPVRAHSRRNRLQRRPAWHALPAGPSLNREFKAELNTPGGGEEAECQVEFNTFRLARTACRALPAGQCTARPLTVIHSAPSGTHCLPGRRRWAGERRADQGRRSSEGRPPLSGRLKWPP